MSDRVVDLRVDDHATPIVELERLYEIHQLLFGSTPREDWIAVDDELLSEISRRLRDQGYEQPDVADAFVAWSGTENLEERVDGLAAIDPVVLRALRGEA